MSHLRKSGNHGTPPDLQEPANYLRNKTTEKMLGPSLSNPPNQAPSLASPTSNEFKAGKYGVKMTLSDDTVGDKEVGDILSTNFMLPIVPPRDFSPRPFSRTPGPPSKEFRPFHLFKERSPQPSAAIDENLADDEANVLNDSPEYSNLNISRLLETPIQTDRIDTQDDGFSRLMSNSTQESKRTSHFLPSTAQRLNQQEFEGNPSLSLSNNDMNSFRDIPSLQNYASYAPSDSENTQLKNGNKLYVADWDFDASRLPSSSSVQYYSDSNSSSSGSYKSTSNIMQDSLREKDSDRLHNYHRSGIGSQFPEISQQPEIMDQFGTYSSFGAPELATIPPIKYSAGWPQPHTGKRQSSSSSQSRNNGSISHGIANRESGSYDASMYSSYETRRSYEGGNRDGKASLSNSRSSWHSQGSHANVDMSTSQASFQSGAHAPSSLAPSSSTQSHKPPSDPLESPNTKQRYKDFSATLKAKFKTSDQEAKDFALKAIADLPINAKWRGYVDLAELSKKMDDADKAREYYRHACMLAPRSSTAWLEWSKMEEENGRVTAALRVLIMGLVVCDAQESLLPRVVKIYERLHYSSHIRQVLSQLKYDNIDKTWKLLLEGCLFEAREGCSDVSRQIFKYLMKHVHWHGPIYHEAFRLEEREGREEAAVQIARTGLMELKHYGPLWFGLMSVLERRDIKSEKGRWMRGEEPELKSLTEESREAAKKISKELTWRVYYEKYMAEERAAEIAARGTYLTTPAFLLSTCRVTMLERCRYSLVQSLLKSVVPPNNLRWKILLVAARLELSMGNEDTARRLQQRAWAESPAKSKLYPILESSRLEEYVGNVGVARQLLRYGLKEMGHDWKGYLEAVLLEIRAGCIGNALEKVKEAVRAHPGTGRLWALYIQLVHRIEHLTKMQGHIQTASASNSSPCIAIIRQAIQEVPKSGEVWCEAARSVMNPFILQSFDVGMGMVWCGYGIHFTPQYGDSFIEYMRATILGGVYLKWVCRKVGVDYEGFVGKYLSGDRESDVYRDIVEGFAGKECVTESAGSLEEVIVQIYNMDCELPPITTDSVPYKHLKQRCINADPNYGLGWGYCSNPPFHLPPLILSNCLERLVGEMGGAGGKRSGGTAPLYCRALLHYLYRRLKKDQGAGLGSAEGKFIQAYEKCLPHLPLLNPTSSLQLPYAPVLVRGGGGGGGMLYSREDFVMGLVGLSRGVYTPTRNQEARRKMIFGGDQIVS